MAINQIISFSGGKDSTAMFLLKHGYNKKGERA